MGWEEVNLVEVRGGFVGFDDEVGEGGLESDLERGDGGKGVGGVGVFGGVEGGGFDVEDGGNVGEGKWVGVEEGGVRRGVV